MPGTETGTLWSNRPQRSSGGLSSDDGNEPMLPHFPLEDRYCHNAFQNRTEKISAYEWFKIILMTVTLIAPLRLLTLVVFLALSALFSWISLIGVPYTKEGLSSPITPWRRRVNYGSQICARVMVFCLGFHWIPVKGRHVRDHNEQAPICISNHLGFAETVYYFYFYWPCITAKADILSWPFFGTTLTATRPVWISQGESNATDVKDTIVLRARNRAKYRQVMMYPEGTTSNGESLIEFQLGAFLPGEPVQPIITRCPYKYFDPSHTDGGQPMWLSVYRTACQFYNNMSVQLLPIYYPSAEEKADPILYSQNVRAYMGRKMGVPLSEQSIHDVLLIRKAQKLKKHIRHPYEAVIGMAGLRKSFGCNYKQAARYLEIYATMTNRTQRYVTPETLALSMDLPLNPLMERLFRALNTTGIPGEMSFWHFGRSMASVCHTKMLPAVAEQVFCLLMGDPLGAHPAAPLVPADSVQPESDSEWKHGGRLLTIGKLDAVLTSPQFLGGEAGNYPGLLFSRIDTKTTGVVPFDIFLSFVEADRRYLKYFLLGLVASPAVF